MIDVLIPTCERPAALAATLATLATQTHKDFRVVLSDQSEASVFERGEVRAVVRWLEYQGVPVQCHRHLPKRGVAEQRQFLLEQATSPYVLMLDDDVLLEIWVLDLLQRVLNEQDCGFVTNAFIGLSFKDDVRPHEQEVELWDGPVQPERVTPQSDTWWRFKLHNAANLLHVQERLGATPESPILYKVAWASGCVLFDRRKLVEVGGFSFWQDLPPEHAGEDVLVQLRVIARHGGCGVMPSGVYHQELPTTVTDRRVDAPQVLPVEV